MARPSPAGNTWRRGAKASGSRGRDALEALIYNHLVAFFSHYYQDGDFISKRRYSTRQERYAIPYNGEEVTLYWANHDQYYVKTAEHFTDYTYTAANGVTVHFKLQAADVEQNNVKGEKRFFLPRPAETSWDGDAAQLVIPFEFRPLTEQENITYGGKNQQEAILARALKDIPKRLPPTTAAPALAALTAEKRVTADGEPVTTLEHHLRQYTRRNTSDFFIHKDLKGFLTRELDFYLKNEVLSLDDMEAAGEGRAEGWFQIMGAIRAVGCRIIEFLAQVEEFQKMLWEKRKFITETQYCVTVGNIAEEFFPEIAVCDAQWDEWGTLFHVNEEQADLFGSDDIRDERRGVFLQTHPTLVLDTRHFDCEFVDRLLSSFDDLDEMTDGLLIHSENWQGLRLLDARYQEQVKCIYIDPPYNTGADAGFVYKDNFQHSTWLAMMKSRLGLACDFLLPSGAIFVSIDDRELNHLRAVMNIVLREDNFVATFVRKRRMATGMRGEPVSPDHEYILTYARSLTQMKLFGNVRTENDYPLRDAKGKFRSTDLTVGMTREMRPNQFYPINHPKVGTEYWPPESRVWRFQPSTMQSLISDDDIIWPDDFPDRSLSRPRFKTRFTPAESDTKTIPISTWVDSRTPDVDVGTDDRVLPSAGMNQAGTKELRDLLGSQMLEYPKPVSLVRLVALLTTIRKDIVLDFFAGSGTTGHAVINLNREDGGRRKFILVEMADYFDTVLLPRIKKVTYTPEWKDGKPKRMATAEEAERGPRIVKVIRLESYEDSLNNIVFDAAGGQQAMEFEDYLLRYMLKWEARKSETLLDIEKLASPFRYKLHIHAGGQTSVKPVDIPETFAYLLGLHVQTRRAHDDGGRRYLVYRGRIDHRAVAVIWRETEGWGQADYERDRQFVAEHKLAEGADEIFVNGDSFIPGARALEPLFKARMFASVEA